jgi:16S rRNA (uracil1498-N3)-methyltransferase
VTLPEAGDAHAFVADLDDPVLSAEDRHHFERVLRLPPGALVTVADGEGGWRPVRFGRVLEPIGPVEHESPPELLITVAFALVKGDRPELVVQKLTEVGVDAIVPFVAARSVARWDTEREARRHARMVRIAREAAMQCRRSRLPLVEPLCRFDDVAGRPGAALATVGGGEPALDHPVVLVGPEGGWSPEELATPLPRVGLAPYVLRSETAAIVAGALLVALRERFIQA